jgi:curved DNA-binding protein CbpA
VPDYFALLGVERRPWLDPEAVKEKFHALAATRHPDVAPSDGSDFAALNAAHAALRDPKGRLHHLLELEAPELLKQPQQIPSVLADLFLVIGHARQQFNEFGGRAQHSSTALSRALLAGDRLQTRSSLEKAKGELDAIQADLLGRLQQLDASWNAADRHSLLQSCAEFHHALSYVSKWSDLLRDNLSHPALAS